MNATDETMALLRLINERKATETNSVGTVGASAPSAPADNPAPLVTVSPEIADVMGMEGLPGVKIVADVQLVTSARLLEYGHEERPAIFWTFPETDPAKIAEKIEAKVKNITHCGNFHDSKPWIVIKTQPRLKLVDYHLEGACLVARVKI